MKNTFKQFLQEVLDTNLDISYEQTKTQYIAKFSSKEHDYQVVFQQRNKDWEVDFSLVTFFDIEHKGEMKLGDQFTVMSGVVKATRHFLENKTPDTLFFVIEDIKGFFKPEFYRKLLSMFSKDLAKLDYAVKEQKVEKGYKFVISKR